MQQRKTDLGFSLVEILISLLVVSLAAVNISGLQKMVADQNRDNFSHTSVIEIVTERLEEVMQVDDMQDIVDLDGDVLTYTSRGTEFTLTWDIQLVSGASSTSPVRDVEVAVGWLDAKGDAQTFTYSRVISLPMLLEGAGGQGGEEFSSLIPNLLNTNTVDYFQSKKGYKKGAYVIYNSQLFEATSVHSVGNGQQRDVTPPIDTDGVVASGWLDLGRIDNADLAQLFIE